MPISLSRLQSIPLFEGLSETELKRIAESARERLVYENAAIIYQDDPGDALYAILRGTVKITALLQRENDNEKISEVILALLGAGDTVGEMSLIDSVGRSANVVAMERTDVLVISRDVFNEMLKVGSTFSLNIMRLLARRLRLANARIQAHCSQDVRGRVAFQLLEFAETYGETLPDGSRHIPIRLVQDELADLVGASRERVSSIVSGFKKSGIISVDQSYHTTIHKIADLKRHVQLAV